MHVHNVKWPEIFNFKPNYHCRNVDVERLLMLISFFKKNFPGRKVGHIWT